MDKLHIKNSHLGSNILGAIVIAVGACLTFYKQVIPGGEKQDLPGVAIFGVVAAVGGLGLLFFRSRTTIDKEARRVERRNSAIIPLGGSSESFGEIESVDVVDEMQHVSRAIRARVRAVYLSGPGTRIRIESRDLKKNARGVAEQIAGYLEVPVRDGT